MTKLMSKNKTKERINKQNENHTRKQKDVHKFVYLDLIERVFSEFIWNG